MSHSHPLQCEKSPRVIWGALQTELSLDSVQDCNKSSACPPIWSWFPKLSRGGQAEEKQHVGGDPRSRGALRFCPAAVGRESKGKDLVAGHPGCPRTNEGRSLVFYKATSLLLGSLVARSAASVGERLAQGYVTCFQDSTPGVISPYSRQPTNGEMPVKPGAPASDPLCRRYSPLAARPP